MRTLAFIAQPKRVIERGRWAMGGSRQMPKTAFPLSKTRTFQLGKSWVWRVDRIAAEVLQGRLLIAFEPAKEKFLAWLSIERQEGHAIVARFEFHGEEPGWHCHSLCGEIDRLPVGVVKPYGTRRIPAARHFHKRQTFAITEASALSLAFKMFRIEDKPEDALV